MAGTKISALTAAAALGGTEAIPGVQSAANVKITAAQIKTFTSASPTLTTPVLGVATGTSLALGGATIGSNALAVTGTALFNGALTGPTNTDMFGGATVVTSGNVLVNSNILGVGGSTSVNFLVEAAAQNTVVLNSGMALTWSSTANSGGNATTLRTGKDTGLSRISAGVIGVGTGAAASVAGSLQLTNLIGSGYLKSGSYTVGTVPSASSSGAGSIIYVSNEAGGAAPAFSDGTNWRRYSDRAIIS